MFDEIKYDKIYIMSNSIIHFRKHTLFGSEIMVDEYSFRYNFDELNTKTLAELLDTFYGVIKNKLCTIEQTNKLEQFNILQDALKTIIKE